MPPTIGVLAYMLAGSYTGPVLSAISDTIARAGGLTVAIRMVGAGRTGLSNFRPDLSHVGWDRIGAYISFPGSAPTAYLLDLQEAGKPVVLIGEEEPGLACPNVIADNRQGVKEAVEHLLVHGHTEIAFVGSLEQFDIRERYEAYKTTLLDHGLQPRDDLFYAAENNFEHGAVSAAERMLAAGLPSTAVVAATDLNAVGIIKTLKAAGLALPRDQAVVGFDNNPDSALLSPSLSTVSQHPEELGGTAAELALRLLAGEAIAPVRYAAPCSFVIRESCGCRRDNQGKLALSSSPVEGLELLGSGAGRLKRALADSDPVIGGLVSELRSIYERAAMDEPSESDLSRLGQICEEIYGRIPSQATLDEILHLGSDVCSELEQGSVGPEPVSHRLSKCLSQMRLSMARLSSYERNEECYSLREAIRNQYRIVLDMLDSEDPRSLGWLQATDARMGALALRPHAGSHEPRPGDNPSAEVLEVVSTFDTTGDLPSDLAPTSCPEALFPPEELLGEPGQGQLACLFPIQTNRQDWGFLIVLMDATTRLTQEGHFMWSDLLSIILDHWSLLLSWRQKSDELALSYQRERDLAEAARVSEERYALAAKAASDGLWDWDVIEDRIFLSARCKEMLGYSDDELSNRPEEWLDRTHPDDRARLVADLSAMKLGERESILDEHRVRTRDGSYMWVLCRGLAVPGKGAPATRLVGSLSDVTERHSLEDVLRHQAFYDSLTGLPNRKLFMDRLTAALGRANDQSDQIWTVLWLDLDNFKGLNDTFGHVAGDMLLTLVAGRIRAHTRRTDTPARFGGDEFALLLEDVKDPSYLDEILHRLSDHLNEPYDLDGHTVVVTASIGVVNNAAGYSRAEDVLRDADTAMYQAKANNRGTYVCFEVSMGHPRRRRGRTGSHPA